MAKVSIITPCYNRSRYVGKTIESVLSQSFTDWEYIIVDDGSTDNSWQAIQEYAAKDYRIKPVHQTNGGACRARNQGFSLCSPNSEYVLWLDSDDLMDVNMLSIMVDYLDVHKQVGLAFCDYHLIDQNDLYLAPSEIIRFDEARNLWGVQETPAHIPQTSFMAIGVYCILEGTALLRKSVYLKTTGWPEWLGQIGEGMYLFTQIALLAEVHFIPKILYYYRQHDHQAMQNAKHQRQWEKLCKKWLENPDHAFYTFYKRLIWFFEYRYIPYRWLCRREVPSKSYILRALIRYLKSPWMKPPKGSIPPNISIRSGNSN
jgi:glycosyltransferase involved in cell wall biosynthesis